MRTCRVPVFASNAVKCFVEKETSIFFKLKISPARRPVCKANIEIEYQRGERTFLDLLLHTTLWKILPLYPVSHSVSSMSVRGFHNETVHKTARIDLKILKLILPLNRRLDTRYPRVPPTCSSPVAYSHLTCPPTDGSRFFFLSSNQFFPGLSPLFPMPSLAPHTACDGVKGKTSGISLGAAPVPAAGLLARRGWQARSAPNLSAISA